MLLKGLEISLEVLRMSLQSPRDLKCPQKDFKYYKKHLQYPNDSELDVLIFMTTFGIFLKLKKRKKKSCFQTKLIFTQKENKKK